METLQEIALSPPKIMAPDSVPAPLQSKNAKRNTDSWLEQRSNDKNARERREARRAAAQYALTRARAHARMLAAHTQFGAARRRARRFGQREPYVERGLCGACLGGDQSPQILSRRRARFRRQWIGRRHLFDRAIGSDKIALHNTLVGEQRARRGGRPDAGVLPPAAAARRKFPRLNDHSFQFREMKDTSDQASERRGERRACAFQTALTVKAF